MKPDHYKTLATSVEGILYKDRKSKFIGYAYSVEDEDEIKALLASISQEHKGANHVCYAWQLGVDPMSWRANDDGEPNNSAGMPIYGQIQAFGLTNILLAVVRYFGGTKLGVGGLISAYKSTAQLTLDEGRIIKKTILVPLVIEFDYPVINEVMRLIKRSKLQILSQTTDLRARYELAIPESSLQEIMQQFESIRGVEITTKIT